MGFIDTVLLAILVLIATFNILAFIALVIFVIGGFLPCNLGGRRHRWNLIKDAGLREWIEKVHLCPRSCTCTRCGRAKQINFFHTWNKKNRCTYCGTEKQFGLTSGGD